MHLQNRAGSGTFNRLYFVQVVSHEPDKESLNNLATLPGVKDLLVHGAQVRRLEAQLLARELLKC